MARKPSRTTLKRRADKLCGDLVRARGYCEAAGKDETRCKGILQWAHIVTRSNHRLRWELFGALCLCQAHHVHYTHRPLDWHLFIQAHFPENLERILAVRNEPWDRDYSSVLERLKGVAGASI